MSGQEPLISSVGTGAGLEQECRACPPESGRLATMPLTSIFYTERRDCFTVMEYNIVNGLRLPIIRQEYVDKIKDMKLYEDDVWIVSYPKSGSTWMQQIVRLIKNRGELSDEKISLSIPWLEAAPLLHPELKVEDIPRPRIFKSHFPYHQLPCGPPNTTPCKYILIVRNPKDVVVSMYFHRTLLDPTSFECLDFDAFWKGFMGYETQRMNYFQHLSSWLPHKEDKNVLFLTYEDMKSDLPTAVTRISAFMGIELSGDVITKVCDLSSFESMKTDRTANKCWRFGENEDGTSKFMRKGTVGDWRNHLSAEQSAQIDARCAQVLKDTAFEFKFGD